MPFLGKDDVATLWDIQIEMVGGDSVSHTLTRKLMHVSWQYTAQLNSILSFLCGKSSSHFFLPQACAKYPILT